MIDGKTAYARTTMRSMIATNPLSQCIVMSHAFRQAPAEVIAFIEACAPAAVLLQHTDMAPRGYSVTLAHGAVIGIRNTVFRMLGRPTCALPGVQLCDVLDIATHTNILLVNVCLPGLTPTQLLALVATIRMPAYIAGHLPRDVTVPADWHGIDGVAMWHRLGAQWVRLPHEVVALDITIGTNA